MSKVIKKAYAEEMKQGYNLRTAMEEASRCLLCHDAPCSKSCPAKTDPAKFIRSLRFRNIKGAAETIRENNPLAGCCAEVCPYGQLCEQACSRTGIDKPIEIGKLQKFLVEMEKREGMEFLHVEEKRDGKIACVGAGPASLACARELALFGYDVTIYEANEKAGGVLTYGIVPSRLPQEVVDFDIATIEKLGVTFKFNETIDAARLEELKAEYDAVFLARISRTNRTLCQRSTSSIRRSTKRKRRAFSQRPGFTQATPTTSRSRAITSHERSVGSR